MKNIKKLLQGVDPLALVSITDSKGTILYVNERFAKATKYKPGELIGQNHRILKSRKQPDKLFDDLWKDISNLKSWRGNIQNKAKDGTYFWVDTSITPIIGQNGRPEYYLATRYLIDQPNSRGE